MAKNLYVVLKEKLNCEGLTLVQNNGLGQEVKHYHLHLIPRYTNDDIKLISNEKMIDDIEETMKKLK